MAHERTRMATLNTRLNHCKEKIRLLSTTTRAVTIYASAKFPALEIARHSVYTTLHDGIHHPTHDVMDDGSGLASLGAEPLRKETLSTDDEVLTRTDRRNAVINLLSKTSLIPRSDTSLSTAGLGHLPQYLPSVCAILLFNSKARPYKAQKTLEELITREHDQPIHHEEEEEDEEIDPLASKKSRNIQKKKKNTNMEDDSRKLGSAPKTFTDGDTLPALAPVEYAYKPKMRDIGTFELPSNLALPNVADIGWSASMSSIAPSVIKQEQPVLPTILDLMPPPPPPTINTSTLPSLPSSLPPPPDPMLALPPIPSSSSSMTTASMYPAPPAPTAALMNSLPPPPSIPMAPTPSSNETALPSPPSISSPAPPSLPAVSTPPPQAGRSGLLAALTNPDNLKKLRKIKEGEEGGESSKPPPAPAPAPAASSNMTLAEMAAKLALRRKAMTGESTGSKATSNSSTTGTNAPPTPARPGASNTASSSNDTGSSSTSNSSSGSTGMFKPESMHGFKMTSGTKKSKKRKDSDDDWSDSDSD